MKISKNWLSEFIPLPKNNSKLESSLTNLGLEVDVISKAKDDYIIDIEFTPNRGDCLSLYGTARDLSSKLTKDIKLPEVRYIDTKLAKSETLSIIDKNICPEYRFLKLKSINNSKSTPNYIKNRLRKSNITSVNLIVDLSNYVMMELGQPTHAFDLDKIEPPLSVQKSTKESIFYALDNKEYIIPKNTPVIIDKSGIIHALPGIIGGKLSSVTKKSKNILFESAFFLPDVVRRLASKYRIQTDSSYRFERGVDYNLQEIALKRICHLVYKFTTLEKSSKIYKISKAHSYTKNKSFVFDKNLSERVLGIKINQKEIKTILMSLGFILKNNKVTIPSYRFDINNNYDLVEEIARVYGYNNIPEKKFDFTESSSVIPFEKCKEAFVYRGYKECINFSFISSNDDTKKVILLNPISSDKSEMRESLLPGLISNISYNSKRKHKSIKLFELGKTFTKIKNKINEKNKFSVVIYGEKSNTDLATYSYKMSLDDLTSDILSAFPSISFSTSKGNDFFDSSKCLEMHINKKSVGYCGLISKKIAKSYNVEEPIIACEFDDIDNLPYTRHVKYDVISQYPPVFKDITVESKLDDDLSDIIKKLGQKSYKYLKNIRIKDIFIQKDNLQSNNNVRFVTLEICLQSKTKTLSDKEINKDIDMIIENLQSHFDLHIKEA